MSTAVKLIGLDFGTTTSSAVIATAQLASNSVTGRMELSQLRECYRSDLVFTPLRAEGLDERRLEEYLDAWLAAGQVRPEEVFGGGALLTGLTAQKDNAAVLVQLVRQRLGNALIATADDPCLEAWLAFMGSCAGLSRAHPDRAFLNLDVGGGTTNLALGKAGEVQRTGCLFVGARHIHVVPGTYRLVQLSRWARALLDHLGIRKGPGESLTEAEVETVLDFYLSLLEGAVTGVPEAFDHPVARLHQQVALPMPHAITDVVVTLSGGVGELVYARVQGRPWPPTTYYGDLGIDLARRLLACNRWADQFRAYVPAGGGRATVCGLLRHSTQVSGRSVFLSHPEALPLTDLPIFGRIANSSTDAYLGDMIDLVRKSPRGGCLHAALSGQGPAEVRELGRRLAQVLRAHGFPSCHPLVLLVTENLGKVLGQYVSEWGALPLQLVVVDEIAIPNARYAHIGSCRDQVVPISFYGLNEPGETP